MDKKSRELVMGKLYFKNKDYKMAEKSFLEYLNSNPDDFQALKLLAQVYENLRNFSSAFDLYERCYLAEPERKGVLLDICRLLLMNDTRLSHIDQRKWLKLAIQAFPSNPIVVNLRESLPAVDSTPTRTPNNDEVLRKLVCMEKQLSNLEQNQSTLEKHYEQILQQLRNISIAMEKKEPSTSKNDKTSSSKKSSKSSHKVDKTADHQPKIDKPTITSISEQPVNFSRVDRPISTPKVEKASSLSKVEKPTPPLNYDRPASPLRVERTASPHKVEKPVSPPKVEKPVSPPKVEKPSSPPKGEKPASPPKVDAPIFPSQQVVQDLSQNVDNPSSFFKMQSTFSAMQSTMSMVPTPAISNISQNTEKKDQTSSFFQNSSFESPFSMNSASFSFAGTSNLFADSLKKLNMPLEGSWTTKANNSMTFGTKTEFSNTQDDNDNDNDDGDDDEGVKEEELPIENTCDMKPIEIKSGEEEEDTVFEQRCKLHRFKDKEYKERGIGQMKVLRHKETGKGRLVMRRELVNLLCLNCWSITKIERVRDLQVRFAGIDASDGDPEMTVFLAKFKTQELTDAFISHLRGLFSEESS